MTIRTRLEKDEEKILSPYARLSSHTKGRLVSEEECEIRPAFQHDRDRILHSKSFRRLKHKTQVFLAPTGDHYRTRLTHTLEVSQIARTIAKSLRFNEDLTEAIALGHDLGHTPFGHAGERVLNELVPDGFHHVRQSLRVVEKLEKDGHGLNLTYEVRDGILKHSKGIGPIDPGQPGALPLTLEGQVVRRCDILAYVNHDLDDALRGEVIAFEQVPRDIVSVLGATHGRRIDRMVRDMIECSLAAGGSEIHQSQEMEQAVIALRDWLYENVYRIRSVHDDFNKAARILRELYQYFVQDEAQLTAYGGRRREGDSMEVSTADFLAGMTDRYAMNLYHELFLPQPWKIL